MATLHCEADELVLRLSPREKLGALHGDVRGPLKSVRDVAVSDTPFHALRGLRAPGTALPRRIALGTWRYRGGKDFAALDRGKSAVIVSLQDAPFGRLLVSADDAEDVAAHIRAAT